MLAKCLLNACFKAPALNTLDLLSGLVAVQIHRCTCCDDVSCPCSAVLKGHTTPPPGQLLAVHQRRWWSFYCKDVKAMGQKGSLCEKSKLNNASCTAIHDVVHYDSRCVHQ